MNPRNRARGIVLLAAALLAGGCANRPPHGTESALAARPEAQSVLRSVTTDRALEDRILALDPDRISEDDVRDTLAKAPAPRIVLVHGGIFPVYLIMASTGRFLSAMGYPESKIRHPDDGRPADRQRAAGDRPHDVLRFHRGRRRRGAAAADPVEHDRQAAHPSRHRGRFHRVRHRARSDRLHGAVRDRIQAYVPDNATAAPPEKTVGYGVLWAADVWHSVKKHWTLEAQRLIRAKRAVPGLP
jgi:hypothetical protein